MRIRTIKPTFWDHPVISRQSDCTRLLAIGLLNLADDEGYFLADPILVRNAIRPFDEDSANVRRGLYELSKIGYIEISDGSELGSIGKIVKFEKHQRVDRPTTSKYKTYFNSSRTRRGLVEDSSTEGKGREGNSKGKEVPPQPPSERSADAETPPPLLAVDGLVLEEERKTVEVRKLALGKLFSRRETTRWSPKEIKAFNAGPKDCPEDEFQLLCNYYASDAEFLRHDLSTLLNNWSGEIDRAKGWKSGKHNKKYTNSVNRNIGNANEATDAKSKYDAIRAAHGS